MDFSKQEIQSHRLNFIRSIADSIEAIGCLNIDSMETHFENEFVRDHPKRIADCLKPDLRKVVITIQLSESVENVNK